MSNCPKCGYPISPEETACSNCGEPVQNTNEENVSPENIEESNENESVESFEEIILDEAETPIESLESEETSVDPVDSEIVEEELVVDVAEPETLEASAVVEESLPVADEITPVAPTTPETLAEAQSPVEGLPVADGMMPVAPTTPETLAVAQPSVEGLPVADGMMPVAPTTPETLAEAQPPVEGLPMVDGMTPIAPAPVIPVASMVAPTTVEGLPVIDTSMPDPLAMIPDITIAPMQSDVLQSPALPIQQMPEAPMISQPAPALGEEPKKEKPSIFNKIMFFLVFLVSVAAIALLAFFMFKIFSSENIVQGTNIPEASREYHYEGFNLYIEEKDKDKNDIHAEIYDGEFYIGSQTWSAVMTLQTGTYNTLLSNKSQLIDYFKDMGYEATEPVEKEIGGTAFVKMEVVMGGKNVLVAYAKANGTKLFGIVLENETGEYTDDDLRTIGTLLATAKYVGPEYSLPEGFHLDSFKETFMVAE